MHRVWLVVLEDSIITCCRRHKVYRKANKWLCIH